MYIFKMNISVIICVDGAEFWILLRCAAVNLLPRVSLIPSQTFVLYWNNYSYFTVTSTAILWLFAISYQKKNFFHNKIKFSLLSLNYINWFRISYIKLINFCWTVRVESTSAVLAIHQFAMRLYGQQRAMLHMNELNLHRRKVSEEEERPAEEQQALEVNHVWQTWKKVWNILLCTVISDHAVCCGRLLVIQHHSLALSLACCWCLLPSCIDRLTDGDDVPVENLKAAVAVGVVLIS